MARDLDREVSSGTFSASLNRKRLKSIFFTYCILIKSKFDMKKRTAFIGAILSLMPIWQPFLIKTGVVLSTTGLMLYVPEKASASNFEYYFNNAYKKAKKR